MSKSIYEEAIGQLLKIQGRLSTNYDKFAEVKQALEQAQKQEKLLELYKELSYVRQTMLIDTIADDQFQQASDKEEDLTNQIKELEK